MFSRSIKEIKSDFPILDRKINGQDLIYMDNSATSQKPKPVIDALVEYYNKHNSNVHRGLHTLSEEATDLYENARATVGKFINAYTESEVIFTSGTTHGLNIIARMVEPVITGKKGTILITDSEHHSNFVPWQQLAHRTGMTLVISQVKSDGSLDIAELKKQISKDVKLVVVSHASNVLGTINPIKEISKIAHASGALVIVDGAQAIPHLKVDVRSLGCDVYAFSGHKMLGPTGIGCLWVKKDLLAKLDPVEYGGGMINEVSVQKSVWAGVPDKYEAGTPNIAGAVGLAAAIKYLENLGMDNVRQHELELTKKALELLSSQSDIQVLGPKKAEDRTGLVSFHMEGVHAHDIAAVFNTEGIAIRSGHHCAMPLHKKFNIAASARISFYIYNSVEELAKVEQALAKVRKILK